MDVFAVELTLLPKVASHGQPTALAELGWPVVCQDCDIDRLPQINSDEYAGDLATRVFMDEHHISDGLEALVMPRR
jgi:hypothetical protein